MLGRFGMITQLVALATLPVGQMAAQEVAEEPAATSLSALHDIVVPVAVPFWPPAPGWYAIALFALAALITWLVAWRRRVVANRYRGAALQELDELRHNPEQAVGLSALLKRVALAAWPRSRVASMTGSSWWQFVDADSGGDTFSARHGKTLEELAYRDGADETPGDEDVVAAVDAVDGWIRHHHGAVEK